MFDLLGREIKKGDLVLISGVIYIIISSHSRTIKYKGRTDRIMSTHMSEKVFLLNDPTNAINNIYENDAETIKILNDQNKEKEEKILTVEEILTKKLEQAEKLKLKKQTIRGSIIIDNSNIAYIYLGTTITPQGKIEHNYMRLGWRTTRTPEACFEIINSMNEGSYWLYLETRASLKQPMIINNNYVDRIISKINMISSERITNVIYLENLLKIRNIINAA